MTYLDRCPTCGDYPTSALSTSGATQAGTPFELKPCGHQVLVTVMSSDGTEFHPIPDEPHRDPVNDLRLFRW